MNPLNPSADPVDVSIVIPARNEAATIGRCLDAVFGQQTDYTFEVIVIDSGSTDGTLDVLRQYPAVQLLRIRAEEFGHGKTRNLGARSATGRYLVFLNADAVPADSSWLNHLLSPFSHPKNPPIAGVYSRHLPHPDCDLYMVRDLSRAMPATPKMHSRASALDFFLFSTVSGAIDRDIWARFPFEDTIPIAEDQEWGRRVLTHGFSIVYEPASTVYHSHRYSPDQLEEIKFRVGVSETKFNSRLAAQILGFFLALGGMVTKMVGDGIFILFLGPRFSLREKGNEFVTAFKARVASFRGRYRGWNHRWIK
ncbi:MAG: glycosyltransferase family 2 protein [Candidatus Omnitrophota bacterium]